MATATQFRETHYLEAKPQVDQEGGLIRGVKVLGIESRNQRRYPNDVMKAAAHKYEGVKVYIDHPKRSELGEDRSFRDWAGNLRSPRVESDGIYADVRLRRKSESYEEIIEAATDFWKDFGFSHVADCDSYEDHGVDVVESINEVLSADIVTEPATTNGLYESMGADKTKESGSKRVAKKFREIVAGLPDGSGERRILREMEEDLMAPEAVVEMAPEASADEQMKAAFRSAIVAAFDDSSLDTKATIARIGEVIRSYEKLTGDGKKDDAPDEDGGDDSPAEESAKLQKLEGELNRIKCESMLLKSGREATDIRVEMLAGTPESKRKDAMESWPTVASKKPSGGGDRPDSSPSRYSESDEDEDDSYASTWTESLSKARA